MLEVEVRWACVKQAGSVSEQDLGMIGYQVARIGVFTRYFLRISGALEFLFSNSLSIDTL